MRVIVSGAAGVIGQRVVARLTQAQQNIRLHKDQPRLHITAIDKEDMTDLAGMSGNPDLVGRPESASSSDRQAPLTTKKVDLQTADLPKLFSRADIVVHLASTATASTLDPVEAGRELLLFRRTLDALAEAEVPHLIVISSAMVYGARHDNPIPLTEDMPARPNLDFRWVMQKYSLEQLAQEWAQNSTLFFELSSERSRSVTILRPTAVVTEGQLGHLAAALQATRSKIRADGDPPAQYLHVDDLAAAVATAVYTRYNGILNVAPDGWIPPDQLAELEGPRARLRVPAMVAKVVNALRWRWRFAPTPPGVVAYTVYSWIIANDRLRELGWTPAYSNEEAWVVSHDPGRWESFTSSRRKILIAVAVGAVLTVSSIVAWMISWIKRHHKAQS